MSSTFDTESPKTKCAGQCGELVTKKFKHYNKSPGNGDSTKRRKKYEDDSGNLWHGKICPKCAAAKRQEKYIARDKLAQEKIKAKLGE